MKKRDDLFHLIKAMSKSEKRYFTLDAKKSSSKGSKYLVLFQAVNDMEIYDEAKLKKKFGKNLRYDKSYLYEAIMRSMRDYRSANSYAARIKEMILDAQYLYERSLYQQCGKRLEEAKELAKELDDQLSILEINKLERLLLRQTKVKSYQEKMLDLIGAKDNSIKSLQLEMRYLDLLDNLVLEVDKRFSLKSENEIAEFHEKYPSSYFDLEQNNLKGRTQLRFFQSAAFYAQLLRRNEEVLGFYSKVVQWWDLNDKIKEDEFHKYVIDVSTLLHAYSNKGDYHQILPLLKRLEEGTPKNQHDQGVVFQKTIIYRLLYYINTGSPIGVGELVQSVQEGLDKFQIKDSTKNVIIFNTSLMLFLQEKFQQCVDWNTRIMRGTKYITRRDIRNGVLLLNLVAIYELEEIERLEAFQRSVTRAFSKERRSNVNNRFEVEVLTLLKALFSAPPSEFKKLLVQFSLNLKNMKKDPDIRISLGLDDLLFLWIRSKLERIPMVQQIQDQNAKT